MSLATLGLALTLIVWAFVGFAWLPIDMNVVYVLALITGLLFLFVDFLPALPTRRRD